jgi:dGTPase
LCDCELFREQYEFVTHKWPGLDQKRTKHELVRRMINKVVIDLVANSKAAIDRCNPATIEDVRNAGVALIGLSDEVRDQHLQLKQFLYKNLYRHERVRQMSSNAGEIITTLFKAYMNDPACIADEVQNQLNAVPADDNGSVRARVIADYIAGMTDRFAIAEAERVR